MLHFFLMLITAPAPYVCEFPTAPAPLTDRADQAAPAPSDRPGPIERIRDRLADRRARRDRNEIDRTLRHFFRSLRHRIAERRAHRATGPLARFRDRRGRRHHQEDGDLADGQVTVPNEQPVDLPLYPQPNQ